MTQVLELTELPQDDRVTEMKVGSLGIGAELHAERHTGLKRALEFSEELVSRNDFRYASLKHAKLREGSCFQINHRSCPGDLGGCLFSTKGLPSQSQKPSRVLCASARITTATLVGLHPLCYSRYLCRS